jgi:hypothetical protein
MRRYSRLISMLIACVVGLVIAFPAPAQAAVGDQPFWSSFPLLTQGQYWNSNLVKLWQQIVQSDVGTGKTCSQFVDGQFGSNTDAQTRNWQSTFNIGVDGRVGPQTWSTAQSHLRIDHTNVTNNVRNGWGDRSTFDYYYYAGRNSWFYIAFDTIEHFQNGYIESTSHDPWVFYACGQPDWIPVIW